MGNIKNKHGAKKIMVFSTKGGSGRSFISVNLAIDLFNKSNNVVILFDMDYQSGDDASIINITPRKTIYDLVLIMEKLNFDFLKGSLTKHNSGIHFLPAPNNSIKAESINAEQTVKIMDMLSEISDYIVIDTPAYFSEDVLSILDKIDCLCMVATMDILSIKNLKESLQILKQLRFYREKIILVLNRANSKVGLTIREVENHIMDNIDITIPSDRLVPLSINRQLPLIIGAPKSSVSKNLNKLTKIIIENF